MGHNSEKKLKILFWSPKGSTTHYYGGPVISSFRLYKRRDRAATKVSLAHGSLIQPAHNEVFDDQHLISGLYYNNGVSQNVSRELDPQSSMIVPKKNHGGSSHELRKLLFVIRARAWLARNARRFDVFHGLGLHTDTLAAALYAQSLGLPAVLTTVIESEMTKGSSLATATGIHRLRLKMLRRIRAFVPISTRVRERLIEIGVPGDRIGEIPYRRINTDQFAPLQDDRSKGALRQELGLKDRPTCLFVGAIDPRKRPHLLVETVRDLVRRQIDAQLVLAGPVRDENYAKTMRDMAQHGDVADRIVWYGFTEEVWRPMQAADVLALPSMDEGLPGAIMQAMACGVPCVYTNISGAHDLIDHDQNGWIISADGTGLTEAVGAYLSNNNLARQHGENARKKAGDKFSDRYAFDMYMNLFEKASSAHS